LFPRDIASIEYSQRMLCYGMKNMIENFRIGMNAVEAASHFYYSKEMPFSVPFGMVFGGEEIDNMGPPRYSSILHEGDFILIGSAIRNSSMARSGIAVGNARQLNKFKGGIMEEFYFPYYENIANWYESIRTGKRGGDIYNAVGDFVEDPVFGVELNPGHLTHLYEWVDSPFYKGSPGVLHPGMVIQCELISRHKKFNSYLLLEEGLVLADAGMRKELESGYPAVFQRIKKRRKYMSEVLGIILDESVLPLSDTQAILNPFLLDINTVLVLEK
jgi:hypothetical protein